MFTECLLCSCAHVFAHVSLDYQHSSACLPYCHPHVTGEKLKLDIIRCAFQGMESEAEKKPLCLLRGILAKSKEDMGNKRLDFSRTPERHKQWSACERRKIKTRFILKSYYKIMKYRILKNTK